MRTKTVKVLAFAVFSALLAPFVLGDCKCARPDKLETTHWGRNEKIVAVEKRSYRELRGVVELYKGKPLKDALVEILNNAGYLLRNENVNTLRQKRIAACRTAADGRFCFRNLPSGKYELRSSINGEWNVTQIYVVVDEKVGRSEELHVRMKLGT